MELGMDFIDMESTLNSSQQLLNDTQAGTIPEAELEAQLSQLLTDVVTNSLYADMYADMVSDFNNPATDMFQQILAANTKALIVNPYGELSEQILEKLKVVNEELGSPISPEIFETDLIPDPLEQLKDIYF